MSRPETDGRKLGTHSCKATLPSWTARWGLAPSARRALGHQRKPGDRMPALYSRDHLIAPLRGVGRMIQAIKACEWDPDCPRSVLLKGAANPKDAGGTGVGASTQQVALEVDKVPLAPEDVGLVSPSQQTVQESRAEVDETEVDGDVESDDCPLDNSKGADVMSHDE
eukprot:3326776-Amphidinium_carterae.1